VTPESIRRWLVESGPADHDGRHGQCVIKGPISVRDNSHLFHAECSHYPTPLAVKLCLRPHTLQPDQDSAQQQYEALCRAWDAMGTDPELSVPRPYNVRADSGLLAVEWVSGATMTERLFSWHCNRTRAQQLIARAARWLRRFHACGALPPGTLDVDEKLVFVREMETRRSVSDPIFARSLSLLRGSAAAAGAVTLERSWLHGDFKSDNLIVSSERTVGIDVQLRHENPVVYDLAPFMNYLELRLWHPSGWRLLAARNLLGSTFLETYCGGRADAIALPLAWIRLYLLLGEWYTARSHAASPVRGFVLDLCYRSVAERICEHVARKS
jgi:aminoglycoside phosphotransferase (APT) family kinase protein